MNGQWMTTEPNPRSISLGIDGGQRGWKLHFVEGVQREDKIPYRGRRSLCGTMPSHGWGLDLFIQDRCARCESKIAALTSETSR